MQTHLNSLIENVLYVGDLPKMIIESDLEKMFGEFGKLLSVEVVKDPFLKYDYFNSSFSESRGFGFVVF
jgi:RNA recognition motif-containing protein